MSPTATATAPAPRHLALVAPRRPAATDREAALRRVRRARRHVDAPVADRRRDPERFAYLKRVYD